MVDQYSEWADQVCAELRRIESKVGEAEFHAVVAASLRGAAIEALEHAEKVVSRAASKEKIIGRREGVLGARMVIRALSMAIKEPLKGDVVLEVKQ